MENKKIGAGVILIDKKTGDILLGRRSFQSPSPNTYSPFGGTFEPKDGDPKTTAKREFGEETGSSEEYEISKTPFYVQDSPKLTFYSYLGLVDSKFPVHINKEHITFGWFPIEHLPSNLHPGFAKLLSDKKSELENIINKLKKSNTDT